MQGYLWTESIISEQLLCQKLAKDFRILITFYPKYTPEKRWIEY